MLNGIVLGSMLMYVFDPDQGRQRRSRFRDAAGAVGRDLRNQMRIARRDLRNRVRGAVDRVLGSPVEHVPDEVLEQRLRARLGHSVRNSGVLDVDVEGGQVVLRGPIVARNIAPLLRDLRRIPGVRRIDHELEVLHDWDGTDGTWPQHRVARIEDTDRAQQLTPAARLLVGSAGTYLLLCGARRQGIAGAGLGALGVLALARVAADRRNAGPTSKAALVIRGVERLLVPSSR